VNGIGVTPVPLGPKEAAAPTAPVEGLDDAAGAGVELSSLV
jgi:hypothetical protein